jgi:hypothetical protein
LILCWKIRRLLSVTRQSVSDWNVHWTFPQKCQLTTKSLREHFSNMFPINFCLVHIHFH